MHESESSSILSHLDEKMFVVVLKKIGFVFE